MFFSKESVIKRKEIIYIAGIALFSILGIFLYQQWNYSAQRLYVVVTAQGKEVVNTPLDTDFTQTITTDEGTNTLVVTDGHAYVESADCTNQVCVHSAAIDSPGETIACLPHHLIVEIKPGGGHE
ncbi:NusG domain II-containing protein [Eubacterium barkeri]|uniref:Uncharacterized protein n=1 Tax=Eubacterium barkeri TaxID=1528 RepID=A0A1H3E1W8_EUBBA|nr:NusG domain II-containing protein [Eubacterium barkeri]SDX71904.1 hypothetical protein SAMN04488579_10637 [Eubacterium barkeri]